mgnify:CR=1 FL=1
MIVLMVLGALDIYVRPNGTNIEGCGIYPGSSDVLSDPEWPPCETISYAVSQCNITEKCTVYLFPGTYQHSNNTNLRPPPHFTLISTGLFLETQVYVEND